MMTSCKGRELLDFSRKGQSGLKPLVSSRPKRDAIQAPQGPSVTRGGKDTRFARTLQALPGQWAPDPGPLEPSPPSNAIQAPQGPSVTRVGKARGLKGRPPARAGNLVVIETKCGPSRF